MNTTQRAEREAGLAILHHITTLGGGVEATLAPGLAEALAWTIREEPDRPLTARQRVNLIGLISLVEGRLGQRLADEIRQELAAMSEPQVQARLNLALSYFEKVTA